MDTEAKLNTEKSIEGVLLTWDTRKTKLFESFLNTEKEKEKRKPK